MAPPWRRENYTFGGGTAQIALIALSSTKLPDPLPVSRSGHGMPEGGAADAITIVARDRADDPAWFVEQVLSPFSSLVAEDLGGEAAATALAAAHAYIIEATIEDPDDLGHVQAAWALAKCVCEEGAAVVIDVYAARAHLGAHVADLAPDRELDVMHEVTLFFEETSPPGPDQRVVAWTHGLRKFGRPDLVLLDIAAPEAASAALLLRDIAAALAAGERIEPGDVVGTEEAQLEVSEFDPETQTAVSVDGPAIQLRRAAVA